MESPMPLIITQVCNGVPFGETYVSAPSVVDSGNSKVYASSLFVHVNERGQDIAKAKDTDDKIVLGCTSEGMVFQIVVDGFYGCDRNAVFKFIDDYVAPLMENYSQNLAMQNNPQLTTTTLIRNIYTLRRQFAPYAEFTMSLGVSYEKDAELYFAGFGIGDTGLAIKRTNGAVEQLAAHTEVSGFKDAFDGYSSTSIDSVIARNTVFNTKVVPGDEIMGYTYTPAQLEELEREFEAEAVSASARVQTHQVRVLNLNPRNFHNSASLFNQFLKLSQETQDELTEKALGSGEPQRFGDDFSVGDMLIPDADLRHQIKMQVAIKTAKNGLQAFITEENRNKGI